MLPMPYASLRDAGTRLGIADGPPNAALTVNGGAGVPDFTLQDFTLKARGQLFDHEMSSAGRRAGSAKLHQRPAALASAAARALCHGGHDDPSFRPWLFNELL
jgi:hypothetical protein